MSVQPGQVVRTAWIDVDQAALGSHVRMSPEAIEKAYRRLLCLGDCAPWPPMVGHWRDDGRFSIDDGRHEFLASLAVGRERIFVAWLVDAD